MATCEIPGLKPIPRASVWKTPCFTGISHGFEVKLASLMCWYEHRSELLHTLLITVWTVIFYNVESGLDFFHKISLNVSSDQFHTWGTLDLQVLSASCSCKSHFCCSRRWPSKVHHCVLVYYYNYRLELQLSKYCSDNGRLKCYAFMHWETEILLSYSWVNYR